MPAAMFVLNSPLAKRLPLDAPHMGQPGSGGPRQLREATRSGSPRPPLSQANLPGSWRIRHHLLPPRRFLASAKQLRTK